MYCVNIGFNIKKKYSHVNISRYIFAAPCSIWIYGFYIVTAGLDICYSQKGKKGDPGKPDTERKPANLAANGLRCCYSYLKE